jgi:signal transduction histidine kinase
MVEASHNEVSRESSRLEALRRYRVLDTPPEAALDDLAMLAAHICKTPIALIGLIDESRVWFKSRVGWSIEAVSHQDWFAADGVTRDPAWVIPDTQDSPYADSPVVTSDPYIRFFVGVPLITPEGLTIGMLCACDRLPRQFNEHHLDALKVLARQVITQLELRANLACLERTVAKRKRMEEVLRDRHHRLRETLHELEQAQAQLVQTEKMSSLGQMVAGVAHEINNPVSFVYGNLTYLSRYIEDLFGLLNLYQQHYPQPSSEIQRYVEAIELDFLYEDLPKILSSMKLGADRIRQIVMSLRSFSRLDETQKQLFDIHQGIENTLVILQHRLKATVDTPGIQILRNYGEIPSVECYAGQISQVFMNILSNAIDALEQDCCCFSVHAATIHHHQITISTEFIAADTTPKQSAILIRIADNGPGIPPEIKEQIFDSFFTTKPVGKGTGLGLSISYQIVVERHGGNLKCFSEPGQGTEFVIELPLQREVYALNDCANSSPNRSALPEPKATVELLGT